MEKRCHSLEHRGEPTWVFGYGSLIYKVDFPYLQREAASIQGWKRRFWQGSHDHRGTPDAPGRVVTLIPAPERTCKGIAYFVDQSVFDHLDYREKNGYNRTSININLTDSGSTARGVVYVADCHNAAFLGEAPIKDLAQHIARSHGPSGSNRDYVLQLAQALREIGDSDPHVSALELLLNE